MVLRSGNRVSPAVALSRFPFTVHRSMFTAKLVATGVTGPSISTRHSRFLLSISSFISSSQFFLPTANQSICAVWLTVRLCLVLR